MMTSYIALIRKEAGSDYGVNFPDFPGCVTAGRTLEEARHMASEALELHLQGLAEDRAAVPEPSLLDTVMNDPHNRDAVAVLVQTAARAPKAIRVNVMLPEDVLTAIDKAATNRSRFLTDAARTALKEAG